MADRSRLRHSSGPPSGRNSWCSSSHSEQAGRSAGADAADIVPSNRHIAESHNDTSEGAVHCFQDEFGAYVSMSRSQNLLSRLSLCNTLLSFVFFWFI